MILTETIEQDLRQALRSRDVLRLSVLRMLVAAIHNREIDKRTKTGNAELTEEEVTAAIRAEAKKRRDAIGEFGKGGRNDLVRKESAELTILESYLPAELSAQELRAIVAEGMQVLGVTSEKEFGTLMGWVMGRVQGRATGERVATLIRETLAPLQNQ